ncbi:hypothetical protein CAEBREN_25684 [Caenorhabditis brenneri]|uniref:Homeobox domain-containing protein n=1 Tax=Caenorhabditis brenneri TaxID=135651 RepID=G0NQ59_CAEBE|nr:hypothetical protein CAEBREN_25684 [Caenorhabditis brenneri]
MYSDGSFNQPEYLQLDMEMEETLTNSPREQQLIPNGDQGTFAQDMGMTPRYLSEFEFIGQQQEQYEYTVLEDPQVFHEEQENYGFEEELYDDYGHEYRSMRTDVQGTYDGRIINNRGHVTEEDNDYIPNGRQMTHNDVNVKLNQRYGHDQMNTEYRVRSQNHFNGVEDQYCSEDDIEAFGMPNGVQGFNHAYDYPQPNGIQYHLHQGQLQSASSSRAASMASDSSFGHSHERLQPTNSKFLKPTRHRTKFEKWQIDALEERFEQSDSYSKREMMVMVEELGLSSVDQVKFWFKNRKQKRTKELKEQNLYQSPARCHPIQTYTSTPHSHPYDNSFVAPSPIHNQISSQCHPQNEDPMQPSSLTSSNEPLRRVSKKIEDWQVKVLEHKFAGKYFSTKAQNEEAATELGLTIDQVKYFMRKKRLNRRDN